MQWITDHAVLRFLERAYGIAIEEIRAEIAAVPGLHSARLAGATSYSSGGMTFRLSPMGHVTTVVAAQGPASGRLGSTEVHGFRVKARGAASRQDQGRHQRRVARGVMP